MTVSRPIKRATGVAGVCASGSATAVFFLMSWIFLHSSWGFVAPRARPTRPLFASVSSVLSLEESAPRDVASLEDWASVCGVQYAEGFQLSLEESNDGSGSGSTDSNIGVVTTTDLPAESPLLFVPGDLILTASAARQEFLGPSLQAAEELLGRLEKSSSQEEEAAVVSEFALFLKILVEYEQGDASPWFPWLNALPRKFYNGASMTPFCYECLPPLVANLAMKERVKFINFFEALKQVDMVLDDTKKNKDVARWAFQIVTTRAFASEQDGEFRIVPMADMFNHGTEAEAFLSYDEDGNCYAYTTMDVLAGSPIRVSYGDPTNPSYLFSKYGFVPETSPATFCKIMLKPTSQLRDLGYEYSRMLFFKDTGEASAEVWDVLLYQNLATDFVAQKAFYDAHMAGDETTKQAMHEHYYPQTLSSLRQHVDSFLQQLEELSQKAVGRDYREHPRLPLILRHNEFVKETFLAVKGYLDSL